MGFCGAEARTSTRNNYSNMLTYFLLTTSLVLSPRIIDISTQWCLTLGGSLAPSEHQYFRVLRDPKVLGRVKK